MRLKPPRSARLPVFETIEKYLPQMDVVICPASRLEVKKTGSFQGETPREAYRKSMGPISGNYVLLRDYDKWSGRVAVRIGEAIRQP